ncbi:hypothetical protein [Chitinophaga rhizophila]|uniref:DUF3575 domain-containing protein n=1 Tax=Chitinophaga rhizophila TaxID=2866212 RepID=A0ABS7GCF9_9BACT|nr:hypothetical protein [Chitinophaga rhizophila]MBW8685021.1 hypothetical protein [Chitinophaga rhizophila]
MKHLLLTFYALIFSGVLLAQDAPPAAQKKGPARTGIILHTTLSTLTETDAGPSLGIEYRLLRSLAFSVDATALLYSLPDVYDDYYTRSGYRIRPEIKFFPAWGLKESRAFYVSLMGTYKRVGSDEVDYDDEAYPHPVRRIKQVRALSANMGIQRYLGPQRRFMLELYAGLGLRHRRTTPLPYYAELDEKGLFEGPHLTIDEDGYNPQVAFGFKLGYRF